mmetsp:Transcript_11196/g.48378  ORF Transcript_11196/g.48378 Transcript_11196/m.48378 type:complete len:244 (-) Transcript_11196:576-1307(-)
MSRLRSRSSRSSRSTPRRRGTPRRARRARPRSPRRRRRPSPYASYPLPSRRRRGWRRAESNPGRRRGGSPAFPGYESACSGSLRLWGGAPWSPAASCSGAEAPSPAAASRRAGEPPPAAASRAFAGAVAAARHRWMRCDGAARDSRGSVLRRAGASASWRRAGTCIGARDRSAAASCAASTAARSPCSAPASPFASRDLRFQSPSRARTSRASRRARSVGASPRRIPRAAAPRAGRTAGRDRA